MTEKFNQINFQVGLRDISQKHNLTQSCLKIDICSLKDTNAAEKIKVPRTGHIRGSKKRNRRIMDAILIQRSRQE